MLPIKGIYAIPLVLASGLNYYCYNYVTFILLLECSPNHIVGGRLFSNSVQYTNPDTLWS